MHSLVHGFAFLLQKTPILLFKLVVFVLKDTKRTRITKKETRLALFAQLAWMRTSLPYKPLFELVLLHLFIFLLQGNFSVQEMTRICKEGTACGGGKCVEHKKITGKVERITCRRDYAFECVMLAVVQLPWRIWWKCMRSEDFKEARRLSWEGKGVKCVHLNKSINEWALFSAVIKNLFAEVNLKQAVFIFNDLLHSEIQKICCISTAECDSFQYAGHFLVHGNLWSRVYSSMFFSASCKRKCISCIPTGIEQRKFSYARISTCCHWKNCGATRIAARFWACWSRSLSLNYCCSLNQCSFINQICTTRWWNARLKKTYYSGASNLVTFVRVQGSFTLDWSSYISERWKLHLSLPHLFLSVSHSHWSDCLLLSMLPRVFCWMGHTIWYCHSQSTCKSLPEEESGEWMVTEQITVVAQINIKKAKRMNKSFIVWRRKNGLPTTPSLLY